MRDAPSRNPEQSRRHEQSRHYREMASAIRAQLPTMQDEEIITELYWLAVHYERLAVFADSGLVQD
jgi:hypothetical protein